jgi:hypothetical protein
LAATEKKKVHTDNKRTISRPLLAAAVKKEEEKDNKVHTGNQKKSSISRPLLAAKRCSGSGKRRGKGQKSTYGQQKIPFRGHF